MPPADILRETDAPDTPDAGRYVVAPQFADLADATTADQLAATKRKIDAARAKSTEASGKELAAIETANARQKAADDRVREAQDRPRPQPPGQAEIPPQPSLKLRDFLASSKDETPENTISKLIQGVSIMAAGIVGLRRGDATAALASLHGALKGWQEGDRERADRAFADWSAAQKRVSEDWERRHRLYRDALENHDLTIQDRVQAAKLIAIENGHDVAAAAFETGQIDKALQWYDSDKKSLEHTQALETRIREAHAEKEAQREFLANFWKLKQDEKQAEKKREGASAIPSGEMLEVEGRNWFTDPNYKQPPGIRGQNAYMYAMAVRNAGIEWAKKNGIDPMSSVTVRAEVKAARDNLTKLTSAIGTQEAAIRRFEGHAKQLLEISEKVDRADMPAVNSMIIKGERDYKGSPMAAALVFQAFEVGMEFSKVVVPGNSTGDLATREEARRSFAAELGKGQMRAVVKQAERNAHRNIETNKESLRLAQQTISTLGGRLEAPPMPPPPSSGNPQDPLGILSKPEATDGR
jgi:hypothetical protein